MAAYFLQGSGQEKNGTVDVVAQQSRIGAHIYNRVPCDEGGDEEDRWEEAGVNQKEVRSVTCPKVMPEYINIIFW